MDMLSETGDKRAKFVRLAEARTHAALNAIRKIGNLSNRRSYEWSSSDIKKIAKVLQKSIAEMEQKFDPQSAGEQKEFRL
jgi:hypothetical protein|tara:strand:- start:182 stop:421 length:240 start_codon:yes stop_codon:yes gene_type:complete